LDVVGVGGGQPFADGEGGVVVLVGGRAVGMRRHRINTGCDEFDDIVELITHLARYGDRDNATCYLAGSGHGGWEVAVSALLAEVRPLIPTPHPRYQALADRECQAPIAIGLVSVTLERRHALLTITEDRAAAGAMLETCG
jgi:hypothetical protein